LSVVGVFVTFVFEAAVTTTYGEFEITRLPVWFGVVTTLRREFLCDDFSEFLDAWSRRVAFNKKPV
jgi:hypothetical protein